MLGSAPPQPAAGAVRRKNTSAGRKRMRKRGAYGHPSNATQPSVEREPPPVLAAPTGGGPDSPLLAPAKRTEQQPCSSQLPSVPLASFQTLEECCSKPTERAAAPPPPPPHVDLSITALSPMMTPAQLVQWIDELPGSEAHSSFPSPPAASPSLLHPSLTTSRLALPQDLDVQRQRHRASVVVNIMAAMLEADWRACVYVRTSTPPLAPIELSGSRLLVLVYESSTRLLHLSTCIAPQGDVSDLDEALAQERELLSLAEWMATHMPEIPRKGEHVGMPGRFYCLGVHLSQHRGASAEIEPFQLSCRCGCNVPGCNREADYCSAIGRARTIVKQSESILARAMPTEDARQAALAENYFVPFAEFADVYKAAFLGHQHALCCSVAHKTAPSHGGESDNNHLQLNYLVFSAPPYLQAKAASDSSYDMGVWAFENGELYVRLRPRLELWFNSGRTHQCLPSFSLLPYACDAERLRIESTDFAEKRVQEALTAMVSEPVLQGSFASKHEAAGFVSSLVGTTTFQQANVTHQMLKALKMGCPAELVRGVGESKAGRGRGQGRGEGGRVAGVAGEAVRATKRTAAAEMKRIRALQPGQRVWVCWTIDDTYEEGVVVEHVPGLVSGLADVSVMLRYGERVCREFLGVGREWGVL